MRIIYLNVHEKWFILEIGSVNVDFNQSLIDCFKKDKRNQLRLKWIEIDEIAEVFSSIEIKGLVKLIRD